MSGRTKVFFTLLILGCVLVGKELIETGATSGRLLAVEPESPGLVERQTASAEGTAGIAESRQSASAEKQRASAEKQRPANAARKPASSVKHRPGKKTAAKPASATSQASASGGIEASSSAASSSGEATTAAPTSAPKLYWPLAPSDAIPAPTRSPEFRGVAAADPGCKLAPQAYVHKIQLTKDSKCVWQWIGNRGICRYKLVGDCHPYFDKSTNCTFYGHHRNEQRVPQTYYLPPAPGEISLTARELISLREPMQPCMSRPRYWMITYPPLASPDKPLPILAGGAPSIAQHIYYVEGEVAGADVYKMHLQNPADMKIIVDLGGNIGLFSISACKRFPKARILAFEPHPGNFRMLHHNIIAAGCEKNVELYNKGVSKDGRRMILYWHDSIGTSAYRGPTAWNPHPPTLHMETLAPKGLWDLVGHDQTISLMKVDCEGCEYEVVPLIPQWRVERMFCEVHTETVNILDGRDAIKGMTKDLIKRVGVACAKGKPYNTDTTGMPEHMKKAYEEKQKAEASA